MMGETQEKLSEYYALKPSKYLILVEFKLTQGLSEFKVMEQSILFQFKRNWDDEETLYLELLGVRNLVFQQSFLSEMLLFVEILPGPDVNGVYEKYFARDPEQEEVFRAECRDFWAWRR